MPSHWPALERFGLAAGASVERLAFAASPEDAVGAADFVQESGPERADTKQQLFAQLDSAAPQSTLLVAHPPGWPPRQFRLTARTPSASWSVTRSTRLTSYRSSRWSAASAPIQGPSIEQWPSIPHSGSTPSKLSRKSLATSPTGFRLRCGRRPSTCSSVVSPQSRTSTRRSPADRDCVGGCSGHSSTCTYPAAPEACVTSWKHLGPPIERWWDDLGAPRLTAGLCETAIEGVERELAGLDLTELVTRRDELLIDFLRARGAAKEIP